MLSTQPKLLEYDGFSWTLIRTFERDLDDGEVVYVRKPLSASGTVKFEEVRGTDVPFAVRYVIAAKLIGGELKV